MSTSLTASIPKGSWVLVTGATGLLGSHVARQFLERGYKVRGTVRDLVKASWLVTDALKTYADRGDFELAHVPDLAADHAFDDAVKGMSAIAHVASIVSYDPNPTKVIPQTVAGTTSIMEAALSEPSVKEFVYTSSFLTTTMFMPGNTAVVGRDSWNDATVKLAWAPPPYEPTRGGIVYMASKVEAEKAVWKFAEERKPHFKVNVICPAMLLGEPLNRCHAETPFARVKNLYHGETAGLGRITAMVSVNLRDVAALHVAAVLDPEVDNARLQAWGEYCNWNDILAVLRRLYPQREFAEDIPGLAKLSVTTDLAEPLALLQKWTGREGWSSLEETVTENVRPIVEWGV